MALPLRIKTIAFILYATCSFAAAQEQVKEAIFEDCERAKLEFSVLDEGARTPLYDYLSRVVALNAQAPDLPEAFVLLPGAPKGKEVAAPGAPKGPDLSSGGLWQTIDAKRELRAKRCALEILSSAGKAALSALSSLAMVYHNQSLSDEIAVALEETIADIAEQAHNNGLSPSDAELDSIVPHLVAARPLVAQNILTEYLVIALPRILRYFSSAPDAAQEVILDFLRSADPDGSRAMRSFIEISPSLPRNEAISVAQKLPFPPRDALRAFLRDFATLSVGIDSSEIFTPLLGRACISVTKLNPDVAAILAPSSSLIHTTQLDIDALRCLVSSSQALARAVPSLVLSAQQLEIERGLQLLPSALPLLEQEVRHSIFSHLRGLAIRPGPFQGQVVPLLALFPERRMETLTSYLQLMVDTQDSSSEASMLRRQSFVAISELELQKDRSTPKLVAAIDSALSNNQEIDAALRLANSLQLPPSHLIRFVSGDHLERSQKILEIVAGRKVTEKRYLSQLVELLRVPQLLKALRPVLLAYKAALPPAVRKILPKLSGTARLCALTLLEGPNVPSKQELSELTTLLIGEPCSSLSLLLEAQTPLLNREDLPQATRTALENRISECSLRLPTTILKELLSTTPLIATPSSSDLQRELDTGGVSLDTIKLLLEHSNDLTFADESRAILLRWILAKGSPQLQRDALHLMPITPPADIQATLRGLASDANREDEVSALARIALARSGDREFDWQELIKTTIERAGDGFEISAALQAIKLLPPEIVLSQVSPALESSSASKVVGACHVAASLGPQAISIVSKLWHLREKRVPSIRYAAVLALLEINPLTPDLQEHVRLILVNRYFNQARLRRIQWSQTVAVADLNKGAFGTLRTIHLGHLLSPPEKPTM